MTKVTDIEVAQKMMQLKQSATSRSLDFDLSFRTVRFLLAQKKCYYTGIPFEESGGSARSIDRVDPSKGYIEGNVVACTVDINGKKSNLTIQEIEQIFKGIQKKTEVMTILLIIIAIILVIVIFLLCLYTGIFGLLSDLLSEIADFLIFRRDDD